MAPPEDARRIQRVVMLSILVWGSALALGSYLFGIDQTQGGIHYAPNPLRGGIVLLCVLTFLGSWLLLLQGRKF